jgi:hypothetical protein
VLALAGDRLTTRYGWSKGSSLRIRSVVVTNLDGDKRNEIVVGGQYDGEGRAALALFAFDKDQLVLRDDASSTAASVTGEVKDLVVPRRLTIDHAKNQSAMVGQVLQWRLAGR